MILLPLAVTNGASKSMQLDERDEAIHKAMAAIEAATPVASADPDRPAFHFHAPAQWINDPNGPIFYKGWYHLFFQYNPYGDQWDHMHWGHARSRDLIHWENLPVALWPSESLGEHHVFSGSTFLDGDGKPVAFYTSIGAPEPEQWSARPDDDDLVRWTKIPHVLTQKDNPEPIAEWRDPFVFRFDGQVHMLTGGGLHGRGSVFLYTAQDPELRHWKYDGVFFAHPDADVANVECPNIALIDGKWVLFTSVHGRVEWFTGHIQNRRFLMEHRGVAYPGGYASQIVQDVPGRTIYLSWVNTGEHKGWNGFHTLPTELHVSADGQLEMTPCRELRHLRRHESREEIGSLSGSKILDAHGDELELSFTLHRESCSKFSLLLRGGALSISYDPATKTLSCGPTSVILDGAEKELKLDVFLDKTAVDVFSSGAHALTAHVPHADQDTVSLEVQNGPAQITDLRIWTLGL